MIDIGFRVGDVLRISSAFTSAVVTHVAKDHVSVRWSWWQVDPEVDWIAWDGNVAIASGPGTPGWENELFRTEPRAEELRAGDVCRVGIPATTVHVIEVRYFDPPLETGWLPRPSSEVVVLRQGVSQDMDAVDQGCGLNPGDDIPLELRLIFRPYAFLDLDDDIVDARERAWRFDGAWAWRAYDRVGDEPIWPLTLLTRSGCEASTEQRDAVASASSTGSYEVELQHWRQAAHAEPPALPGSAHARP